MLLSSVGAEEERAEGRKTYQFESQLVLILGDVIAKKKIEQSGLTKSVTLDASDCIGR